MTNRLISLFILLTLTAACRENSSPEMTDPIYLDLLSEVAGLEKIIEDSVKKIEASKKELETTKPRTIDRKNVISEIAKEETRKSRVEQALEYYKIRALRRKAEGRKSYKIAYRNKQPWPVPEEFEAYKLNKKLMLSSKNWNDRVPKPNLRPGETSYGAPPPDAPKE